MSKLPYVKMSEEEYWGILSTLSREKFGERSSRETADFCYTLITRIKALEDRLEEIDKVIWGNG